MQYEGAKDLKNKLSKFIIYFAIIMVLWILGKSVVSEEYTNVVLAVIALLGLLVFFNKLFVFYLFVALIPFGYIIKVLINFYASTFPFAGIVGAYRDIGIILLLGIILGEAFIRGSAKVRMPSLTKAIVFFIIVCITLFASNSQNYYMGIYGLRRNLLYLALYFITLRLIRDRTGIIKVSNIIIISGIIVGIGAIMQVLFFPITMLQATVSIEGSKIGIPVLRPTSVLQSPNVLGFYLAYILGAFFGFIFNEKKMLNKIFLGIGFFLLISGLILSMSRGAWVALVLGVITWGIFRYKTFLKNLPIIGVAALISLMVLFSNPFLSYRLFSILNPDDGSRMSRSAMIEEYFFGNLSDYKNILIGQGLDSKGYVPDAVAQDTSTAAGSLDNFYIQFFLETGLVGLFSFFAILFYYLKMLLYAANNLKDNYLKALANGLIIATMVFIYSGLFTPVVTASEQAAIFWIFAAISLLLYRYSKIGKQEKDAGFSFCL